MNDSELRGLLLKQFHDLRHNNQGWVPTSDMNVSGTSVDRQAIGGVCRQLADAGLIRWKALTGAQEGLVIGMAQITALGVDVVQGDATPPIKVALPGRATSPQAQPTAAERPAARAAQKPRRAVILTALGVETRAVLRYLSNVREELVRGTVFHVGGFGEWEIAVAECGEGNATAAATVERASGHFDPEAALFVGVAGGVKDVTIGDVLVATKVYAYERGKDTKSGFEPRPSLTLPAYALEQRARAIRQSDAWRARLDPRLGHAGPGIYIGPIAAGEKVVASTEGAVAEHLRNFYGDTLGVEMEGYGFLAGVHINAPLQGSVIRGISDLLDGKANADKAGSQARASDAAGAVAFEMLATLSLQTVRAEIAEPAAFPAALPSAAQARRIPSTVSPAVYFQPGEALAEFGAEYDKVRFTYPDGTGFYLRVIPQARPQRPFRRAELLEAMQQAGLFPMWKNPSGLFTHNRYGAIVVEPISVTGGPLQASTQAFENGELWGIAKWLFVTNRPEYGNIIPAVSLERLYHDMVRRYVDFLTKRLNLTPPFAIELGVVGIENFKLAVDGDHILGPIYDARFTREYILKDGTLAEIDRVLGEFFEDLFGITGYPRPKS
jgi:nucleoside phosphorylase